MTAPTEPSAKVDLAHEPDFRLGDLLVRPSACAVRSGGRDRRVEPRVMEVLVLLARAANRTVTRSDLIEKCWEGRFVSDDAVTRVIGKLRALARSVEPPPFSLETVPKVGFRLVTGAPAQEVRDAAPATPELRRAPAHVRGRPPRLALLLALLVLLVAAASALIAWRLIGGGGHAATPLRGDWVEMAQFRPLQSDPSLKRLSLLSDDALRRALAANGLDPARGSARLRVSGTVDREGDLYLINARVEDTAGGAVLWSRRFDRSLADAAGFQEMMASHVSDVLHCGQMRAGAYRGRMPDRLLAMFLSACSAGRDETNRERYVELARRIVEVEPNLSTAHSMYAMAAVSLAQLSLQTPENKRSLLTMARSEAKRALQLDPRNGEALAALGASYQGGENFVDREAYLNQALQLGWQPANNWYIWLLLEVGRMREATALAAQTVASDPFSINALERLAWLEAVDGDLPSARETLGRLQLAEPNLALDTRLRIEFWHEDPQHALAAYREVGARWGPAGLRCAEQYLAGGWLTPGARRGLPEACAMHPASWRVRMLARSGQIDAAYRLTDAAFGELRENTIFVFYPEMRRFRQDPRFMPLAKRLGLVDYWSRTNRWPDFCEETDLPYDCRAAARAA